MKTQIQRFVVALLLLCTLDFANIAYAQITPSADSYTNSATPTTNFGAKTLLDVDAASQTTYIQFDLSSIPAGTTVSQAMLKLFVNSVTTGGSFNVDYVNGSWTESKIDYSNAPPLGGNIASNVSVTTANKNDYILIDVTPALQSWLNGSETNNGIALVANSTFNATFDSKENTGTSHPPELDVVYGNGTGTITGVLTNSGSGLTGGGTSGSLNLSLLNTCGTNQVLQWNGSAWACASVATGTITGVSAGTALTGGGTNGVVTLNLDTTQVPLLVAPNFFTGNQTINGNLSATGVVTGSGFQIGSNLFDYGSYSNGNAFLGFAGNTSTTGQSNTASGLGALLGNTTGIANAANGVGALLDNTSGGYNTANGVDALYLNTTGSSNTASGFFSGYSADTSSITGSNNTFTGWKSALSTGSLNNATAIGANALVSQSNSMVLGSINGVNGATASTNVGIGTTAPAYSLDVHGTGNFTGLVTFAPTQTFPGTGTITGVTAGTGLTGGGSSGGVTLSNTGILSLAAGTGVSVTGGQSPSVSINTAQVPLLASSNTFTGNQTVNGNVSATGVVTGSSYQIGSNLFAFGSVANYNAFLGFAGNATATGVGNSGTGAYALSHDTTGQNNTGTGSDALMLNTTGGWNTATGVAAMLQNTSGTNNDADGTWALAENTTGSFNTGVGPYALEANSTGSNNTGVGLDAGNTTNSSYTTGSNNTFLGAFSNPGTATALNNATAIGANAQVTASNAMVLGSINGVNGATADTNVGIGTTAPTNPLTVSSATNYIPLAVQSSGTFGTWIALSNTSAGGATWNILSAASGNSEGAGNLAFTNFNPNSIVYIHSNLHVDGAITAGTKDFKIDHPLAPAEKYLSHASIESSEMMNIYSGNVVTDGRGLATVILPDYFEALNRDFRYQLTVVGQFAQAIVAKEIRHNRFTIRTNKPGVKVSWQVSGIRHDAYAEAHRLQVEEDKPTEERGRYLHPELYGAPEEMGIGSRNLN